jgi:hypothetical protein
MRHPFFEKVRTLPDVIDSLGGTLKKNGAASLLPKQDLLEFDNG